jgi:hypothetical protein
MKYINPEDHFEKRIEVHNCQRQPWIQPVSSPLYIITVITNPQRYQQRYRLYDAFEKYVEDSGGVLYTVELALRDRHHEITCPDNPRHIQLRSPNELWYKENLLNIALRSLPASWEYVAWIDADVSFARPDWVTETVHQLQHYSIVQMFSHAIDLGPKFEPMTTYTGFGYCYNKSSKEEITKYGGSTYWHPGYAWAGRRSAINDLGGFGDIGIVGSGDYSMACALIGQVEKSLRPLYHKEYKNYWLQWQARAEKFVRRNLGYVPGTLLHSWHGKKLCRRYNVRDSILIENSFNPKTDIYKDVQGLWQLSGNKLELRDQLRQYFSQRNEDGIDL